MNFTREPILETIISARDGYKLSLKSSKGSSSEEFLVDAVEVVSFGGSFFYRCLERQKPFFLPANDYEILEVRETRLIIKNPSVEKSIKIGSSRKLARTKDEEVAAVDEGAGAAQDDTDESVKRDQKRDKRRNRRPKKVQDEAKSKPVRGRSRSKPEKSVDKKQPKVDVLSDDLPDSQNVAAEQIDDEPIQVKSFKGLITPPDFLVSESLKQYKAVKEKELDESITDPGVAEIANESLVEEGLVTEAPCENEVIEVAEAKDTE